MSWLKRPLTSGGKWRIYPLNEELPNLFASENDYIERGGELDLVKF